MINMLLPCPDGYRAGTDGLMAPDHPGLTGLHYRRRTDNMESAGLNGSKAKLEIRCSICGGRVGKIGNGDAELVCPKCKANVEVSYDGLTLSTKTKPRVA